MSTDDSHRGYRKLETALAWFSLATLVVYVPIETWLSRADLTSPGFLVDVIAFVLLLYGGIHSLRARPHLAPGPLCGAWGFSACLAWRSYFTRVISRQRGLGIYEENATHESVLWAVLIIALLVFVFSLYLARRHGDPDQDSPQ